MSLRDCYCTPLRIARRLPRVDYDPCSNSRSVINAVKSFARERGEDGLRVSWEGKSVGVNPPWSNIDPWSAKLWEADSFWFLVLDDPSTEWFANATRFPCYYFTFNERIGFDAPPEIETSTNDRPVCLIVDPIMRERIGHNFRGMGRWWKSE